METIVRDDFPLDKLECQYFDICRFYEPYKCAYDSRCETRQILNKLLEDYVSETNLRLQVEYINKDIEDIVEEEWDYDEDEDRERDEEE